MKRQVILVVIGLCLIGQPAMGDMTINVPGTSCIYFAGQSQPELETAYPPTPGDWTNHYNFHNDTDDSYSTIPPFVDITGFGGMIVSITATGTWGFDPDNPEGPDGGTYTAFGINGTGISHNEYDDLGVSLLTAPYNGLVGVFLTGATPVAGSAPVSLSTLAGDDMTTPLLHQAFYIGSSLENITIPSGATRLFFGLHDGFGWYDNIGSVDVTVVPAPGAFILCAIGIGCVHWLSRRRTL